VLVALAGTVRGQDITPAATAWVQRLLRAADPPAISMAVWSSRQDLPPASYFRSPFVWTGARVDLTGKAVWNSFNGGFGTTAISPLHVIYANHVSGLYPVGTIIRFVTRDDEPVERIVRLSARIGDTDINLSSLDVPLPGTIHWFKVMPEHWFLQSRHQAPGTVGRLPCVIMDKNTGSVAVKDIAGFYPGFFTTQTPVDPLRRRFTLELGSGDSGSPMFILLRGELLLDGIYFTRQGGPEVSSSIRLLDAAMQGSGCQVTVADLGSLRLHQ